ncbi:MAG: DJ-1/PfpI family protein [Fusobacteriaceae bacterium]|nr:DJ-1/PfpI family protein [Fusobacteriaceae bacterium]MBN2837476.1 DJ-1/PfpI family protein [Fusobacteriaceae bacterium]
MKNIAIHLATGFEETEAITVIDLLRRAGLNATTISITGEKTVTGSHKISVIADKLYEEINYEEYDMIVLPGGIPGTTNLDEHLELKKRIIEFDLDEKWLGAICAAPLVLGKIGLLEDKEAICYPGFENMLLNAKISEKTTVVAHNIITSKGLGTAIEFGLAIIENLISKEKAEEIKKSIMY